jgi:PBSX family phage terminase large subunit
VGLDDPEKLKSIADITSIWVEEGTELTQLDFDQLDLRLRGETEYYKQIIITFNPTDERHWLKKRFFDTSSDNTHIHHSTFQHNAFLDAEYKQVLLSQAQYNANYYQIYALGEWGKTTVKSPFMYNFDITKHTVKDLVPMPNTSYRLSFDFNVNPFVCLIMQISQDNKKVYFLQELILNNGDVPTMCARIKQILTPFELSRCYVTGDAMQRKKEITQRDNLNAWIMIQRELGISDSRMQVPRSNPLIANSQKLCNLILHNHPCVLFDSKMATTINDMMFVECNPDGNKISILKDRSNEDRRADALDAVRYAFNTWFSDYMIKYK